ncbi:MAG: hypothetical protein LBU40_02055 [Methanobrevibacter sp.]|jgi:hypothetical protein|nr:hypothetical protein [Methanobrevibacter sp.]
MDKVRAYHLRIYSEQYYNCKRMGSDHQLKRVLERAEADGVTEKDILGNV